ncbi:TAXI family TRAP transporter solute-binding subunit [Roseovarius sp.]|uniref:TAXI family TRAP transporter solute-binding subunit n=1 Tax=Roseovarius sp. TaxID=1486281 RepID=UPI0026075726|nr:TAXI family TRAP transporter solute-binding subunit [Roseovarius sp.]MDM8165588.1 TAXI family TRAP transporter solute-binding subunit [Roseovarius sp.]
MRLNILAAAVAVALAGSSASAQESIVQGASSSGHTTFQIMTGWSSVINREVPEVSMTVQASGPSVPTTQLVQQGRIQAGPAGNSAPYEAVRSIANFEGQPKADKVRTWMPIYVYGAQLVVPAESDVQDWTDLEGLRVGVGSVGSVGEQTNKVILETLGVGYDKIDEYQIGHGEMVAGLKNGTLDAIIETTGIPTAGVLELEATRDIRIVGLTDEQIEAVDAASDLLSGGVVPAESYQSTDADVPIIVGYTINIINADVDEDLVYKMTKALWENLDELENVHPSQKYLTPDWLQASLLPIAPLHPGAERYYNEQGWLD